MAITARKDYGAVPKGQPLSKSHERALSEAAAARLAVAPSAYSANLSDEDAIPEEGDWDMDGDLECGIPASMPGGRAASACSRLVDSGFLATHPRWVEQVNRKNAKLQSNTSTLQHSMPTSAELQAVPRATVSDGPAQWQGVEHSKASHETLGLQHASSREQASTAAQPPSQKKDVDHALCHSALPFLSVDDKRQDVNGHHAVSVSRKPLSAPLEGRQVKQQPTLSKSCGRSVSLSTRVSAQAAEQNRADFPQLAAEKECEHSNGNDNFQHSRHGLGPSATTMERTPEYCDVQAQNHDRHNNMASQSLQPTELQKLQVLSEASDQQAPQWVGSGPTDLSADLRLAQKLQQEELRWHQLHSKADTAKRKLKKESTLDAFFKRPAR